MVIYKSVYFFVSEFQVTGFQVSGFQGFNTSRSCFVPRSDWLNASRSGVQLSNCHIVESSNCQIIEFFKTPLLPLSLSPLVPISPCPTLPLSHSPTLPLSPSELLHSINSPALQLLPRIQVFIQCTVKCFLNLCTCSQLHEPVRLGIWIHAVR